MRSLTLRQWHKAGEPEGWGAPGTGRTPGLEAVRVVDAEREIPIVLMRHHDGQEQTFALRWDRWMWDCF